MSAAVRTTVRASPEPAPPPVPARVLVVDPDARMQQWLAQCLHPHGHRVHAAQHAEAIAQASARGFDLVMMNPRAPSAEAAWPHGGAAGGDAWLRLRGLRDAAPRLPVIVLQPHADATDRAVALELGADAVVDEDCGPRELRARVAALLRRHREDQRGLPAAGPADAGGWRLDPARRGVHAPASAGDGADGRFIALSPSEFRLLRALMQQPGRPLRRADLLAQALGAAAAQRDRSIDLLVSRLRRTLGDDPLEPRLIRTVRGAGYCFQPLILNAGTAPAPMVSNASHDGDTGLTGRADDHITGTP